MTINSIQNNRLDPSLLDQKELDKLVAAFSSERHVALIDNDGNRTEIPELIYQQLMHIIQMMHHGRSIVMLPEDASFTTQAAANYLGMSRQFLVNLLEQGKIPFSRVGSHRRVNYKDLLDYQKKRDDVRSKTLDELREQVEEAGKYFPENKS